MRPVRSMPSDGFGGISKPGPAVMGLLVGLTVCYVVELIVLRGGFDGFMTTFGLVPGAVLSGQVWQLFTYVFWHDPVAPTHLLFNLLMLYFLGGPLERWWGTRRFLVALGVFLVSGSVLTVLVSLLLSMAGLAGHFPVLVAGPHFGSGTLLAGLSIAFGVVQWDAPMRLMFPPVTLTGKSWIALSVGTEALLALSFAGVSSTSHAGAMIAAALMTTGTWKPKEMWDALRRMYLRFRRRSIERQLQVIDGGKSKKAPGKKDLPN